MKTEISLLLLVLIIVFTLIGIRRKENFNIGPGDKKCVLQEDKCSLEIEEDDDTEAADQKCSLIATAYDAKGSFQKTGVPIIDNGRLRTFEDPSGISTTNSCSFLLSDNLLTQSDGVSIDCSPGNQNLFDQNEGSASQAVVKDIKSNGPYCVLEFQDNPVPSNERLIEYTDFLQQKATTSALSRTPR